MRRLLVLLCVAAPLVLVAPAGAGDPGRVQVVAREFTFALSSDTIKKTNLLIELANFGADPHNLVVRDLKSGVVVGGLSGVAAGNRGELEIKLKPGRYVLFCSYADHESLGMSATLNVKKKK